MTLCLVNGDFEQSPLYLKWSLVSSVLICPILWMTVPASLEEIHALRLGPKHIIDYIVWWSGLFFFTQLYIIIFFGYLQLPVERLVYPLVGITISFVLSSLAKTYRMYMMNEFPTTCIIEIDMKRCCYMLMLGCFVLFAICIGYVIAIWM
jgi:hypothetical protein